MPLSDQLLQAPAPRADFLSTHWSVVLLAGKEHSPQSAAALEKLCQAYWYPLYSFTRRQGYDSHDASDLTQDFFTHLVSSNALAAVCRQKGKFRSFLLASLKNLLANEWNRARCQKRGGGEPIFSLDEETAEGRYKLDPQDDLTPDRIFDRRWAETIMSRALERLREECDQGAKKRQFDELKIFLLREEGDDSLSAAAARFKLTLSALKGSIHRLRRRFRELIRDEIAQTVSSPDEVEQEIRDLFAAFGN
jgi:RNA polymerase sigma factor (sigma-70 family)